MKSLLNFKKRVSMLSDCCHDKSGYMGTSRFVISNECLEFLDP